MPKLTRVLSWSILVLTRLSEKGINVLNIEHGCSKKRTFEALELELIQKFENNLLSIWTIKVEYHTTIVVYLDKYCCI